MHITGEKGKKSGPMGGDVKDGVIYKEKFDVKAPLRGMNNEQAQTPKSVDVSVSSDRGSFTFKNSSK